MLDKKTVVVFHKKGAVLFKNPENLDELLKLPNTFLNPDLSAVSNVPPNYWKVDEGKIVPMTKGEMEIQRDKLVDDPHNQFIVVKEVDKVIEVPVQNVIERIIEKAPEIREVKVEIVKQSYKLAAILSGAALLVGFLVGHYF